jgi:hypothetical protein
MLRSTNIKTSAPAISAIETVPIDQASLEAVLGFILGLDSVLVRRERKRADPPRPAGETARFASCYHPY